MTLIAYRDFSSGGAVFLAALDGEGNVVRRAVLANSSLDFIRGISIAATATRFVVTWGTAQSKLFAIAFDRDGRFLGTPAEVGDGEDPVVATDGTSFTIAWRRWMPDVNKWVLMSRTADAELAQIGLPGDEQTLASDRTIESLSLLWRGDRYEVIAGQQSQTQTTIKPYGLLSIELDRDGSKRVSSRRGDPLFNEVGARPLAVTNGSDILVVYTDPDNFSTQIAARLYRGSSPEPDVQELLSWSGNAHSHPAITSSAAGSFAAWIENVSVYATRIDANGNSLDGRGVEITNVGFAARVAFDGTNYVVAWVDNGFIGVRSIAPATGATVAEVHVPASVLPRKNFAVAVTPEATYLAWVDEAGARVRMTRVSTASHTADLPIAVSPVGMPVDRPAIAWNGSTLLVAWNGMGIPPVGLPNIQALNVQAARVSRGLLLLDPAPMMVATTEAFPLGAPSIASNGEDWLVVTDRGARQIVARRVLRSGNVEGTAAPAIGDGVAPAVTWDGTRYAIAYKSGGTELLPEHPLLLGTVPATGALPMMRSALVATDVVSPPSIARTTDGRMAIIYTKVSFRPEHMGVERSYFRVMDSGQRRRVVRH